MRAKKERMMRIVALTAALLASVAPIPSSSAFPVQSSLMGAPSSSFSSLRAALKWNHRPRRGCLPRWPSSPTVKKTMSASDVAGDFEEESRSVSKRTGGRLMSWWKSSGNNLKLGAVEEIEEEISGAEEEISGVQEERVLGSQRLASLRERLRGLKARVKVRMLDKLLVSVEKDKLRALQKRMPPAGVAKLEVIPLVDPELKREGPASFSELELMSLVDMWAQEGGLGGRSSEVVKASQEAVVNLAAPWMAKWEPSKELLDAVAKHEELGELDELTIGRFNSLGRGDTKKVVSLLLKYVEWYNSKAWGLETRVRDVCATTPGVPEQIPSGKCYLVNDKTHDDMPLVIVKVKRHDPSAQSLDETTRFVMHALFEAEAALSEPESCRYAIVFDMQGATMKNIDYKAVKRLIYILTQYCPERLGSMLLYDAPAFFSRICFPLIKPWLNPETAKKVHFVSSGGKGLKDWVGEACLPREYGGKDDFDYDKSLAAGKAISNLRALRV